MIKINSSKVNELGRFLKDRRISFRVLPGIDRAKTKEEARERLTLLFYVDAICHQTQNFSGVVDGVFKRGWDFLLSSFLEEKMRDPEFISVERMMRIKGSDLKRIFKGSGDRYYERAYLLRNAARILKRDFSSDVMKINEISEGFIKREDGLGMIDLFHRFKAYSDPLSKKTFLFLNIAKKVGFWEIKDEENLWTPVDYHLERVSLRIGIVDVEDPLRRKLLDGRRVFLTEDLRLRKVIGDAVKRVSEISGIPIEKLDQLFWSLGRSLCLKSGAKCEGTNEKNCTLTLITGIPCDKRCIFSEVCLAYRDGERRNFKESNVFTIYY